MKLPLSSPDKNISYTLIVKWKTNEYEQLKEEIENNKKVDELKE